MTANDSESSGPGPSPAPSPSLTAVGPEGASGAVSRVATRPALGERVTFSAVLVRDKTYNGPVCWREIPRDGSGVYVGARTVFNGRHVGASNGGWEGGDSESAYLEVSNGVFHALIAENEWKAPIRVPFAALAAYRAVRSKETP